LFLNGGNAGVVKVGRRMEGVDVLGTNSEGNVPHHRHGQSKDGNDGRAVVRQDVQWKIIGQGLGDLGLFLGQDDCRNDGAGRHGGHSGFGLGPLFHESIRAFDNDIPHAGVIVIVVAVAVVVVV